MLTFVMPTRNRPSYVRRALSYYRETGAPFRMIVADSSDASMMTAAECEPLSDRVRLVGFPSDISVYKKVLAALRMVETEAVCLWADDDFIVPGSASDCARHLLDDPSCSAVSGPCMHFSWDADTSVLRVWPYPQKAWEQDIPSNRLASYFAGYTTVYYAVQRTASLVNRFERIADSGLDDRWAELVLAAWTVIEGRIHLRDRLHAVRDSGHSHRLSDAGPAFFTWLSSGAFSARYGDVQAMVGRALAKVEPAVSGTVEDIVDRAWAGYLAFALGATSATRASSSILAPSAMYRLAARLRGTRLWRVSACIERWGKPSGDWGIAALTDGRSHFAADFLPIHRAITATMQECQTR